MKPKSQYIPIVLVYYYISLIFIVDLELYDYYYTSIITFIDIFLTTLSVLYYFSEGHKWGHTAKRSLITVLSLNILTELSFLVQMEQYYFIYTLILFLYFFTLILYHYNKKHKE